jgi:hypothetical protein
VGVWQVPDESYFEHHANFRTAFERYIRTPPPGEIGSTVRVLGVVLRP